MLPVPVVDWRHPGVRKILALMGPAIFGVSVSQINLLAGYDVGDLSAHRQCLLALLLRSTLGIASGGVCVAIATVILPNLSRHHAASSAEAYSQTLDWALRMVLLIAVPAAAALDAAS